MELIFSCMYTIHDDTDELFKKATNLLSFEKLHINAINFLLNLGLK